VKHNRLTASFGYIIPNKIVTSYRFSCTGKSNYHWKN